MEDELYYFLKHKFEDNQVKYIKYNGEYYSYAKLLFRTGPSPLIEIEKIKILEV